MRRRQVIVLMVCVFGAYGGCLALDLLRPEPPPPKPQRLAPRATTDDEKQKLAETMTALQKFNIVHRCDSRNCYVLPSWHACTIDAKTTYAAAAWSCANNCPSTADAIGTDIGTRRLMILDARDGKQLGSYCPDFGLTLD